MEEAPGTGLPGPTPRAQYWDGNKSHLEPGSFLIVDGCGGDAPLPALVRSVARGGSTWVQLTTASGGRGAGAPKRLSVPLASPRLRPLGAARNPSLEERLRELAAIEGFGPSCLGAGSMRTRSSLDAEAATSGEAVGAHVGTPTAPVAVAAARPASLVAPAATLSAAEAPATHTNALAIDAAVVSLPPTPLDAAAAPAAAVSSHAVAAGALRSSTGESWRHDVARGRALLVQDKNADAAFWRPAVVCGVIFGGGSSWVQLVADDPASPQGWRRMSMPLTSGRLQPCERLGDTALAAPIRGRHRELAELQGVVAEFHDADPAAELAARAKAPIHVRAVLLSGSEHVISTSRDVTVAELKELIASALGDVATNLELISGTELLSAATARPLADVEPDAPSVVLSVLARPPMRHVALELHDVAAWDALAASPERLRLELSRSDYWTHMGSPHFRALSRILEDRTVVGISMRAWQLRAAHVLTEQDLEPLLRVLPATRLQFLDISSSFANQGGLRALMRALPESLQELDVSGCWCCWGHHTVMQSLIQLPVFAHEVASGLRRLAQLRVLRARGLAAASVEVDVRGIILDALPPGCAAEL